MKDWSFMMCLNSLPIRRHEEIFMIKCWSSPPDGMTRQRCTDEVLKPQEKLQELITRINRVSYEIDRKRPWTKFRRRKVTSLHDNAVPHASLRTQLALTDLQWKAQPHPTYGLDNARFEYRLFWSIPSKGLTNTSEQRLKSDKRIVFEGQVFLLCGINRLPERWASRRKWRTPLVLKCVHLHLL